MQRLQFPFRQAEFGIKNPEEKADDRVRFPYITPQQISRSLLPQALRSRQALRDPQHVVFGDVVELVGVTGALRVNNTGSEAFVAEVGPFLYEVVFLLFWGWECEDVLAKGEEGFYVFEESGAVDLAVCGSGVSEIEVEEAEFLACFPDFVDFVLVALYEVLEADS